MSIKTDRADGVVSISSPAMARTAGLYRTPATFIYAAHGPSDPAMVRLHVINGLGTSLASFAADEPALTGLIADLDAFRAVVFNDDGVRAPEPEDVIACTLVGDDEVTDAALETARRIIADLRQAGFLIR